MPILAKVLEQDTTQHRRTRRLNVSEIKKDVVVALIDQGISESVAERLAVVDP
jgi:hypothetical protein